MDTLKFTIKGVSPLLLHSDRLADPLDKDAKHLKTLTSKMKKTDADHEEIRWLDWRGGLYWDQEMGPYMPGPNIRACIEGSARMNRLGKNISRGVIVPDLMCKIDYKGPKGIKELYEQGFYDTRSVVVARAKLMRTRPCFKDWKITFNLMFSDELTSEEQLIGIIKKAGQCIGLGDYRPDTRGPFGRFELVEK